MDTNIIIRHLTQDVPAMAGQARTFLKKVETGELTAHMTEAVLVEAVQVLSSPRVYAVARDVVAHDLSVILGLRGLRIPAKGMYVEALRLWAGSSVDFADALSVAYMRQHRLSAIATFDRDFDRFPGISRRDMTLP